MFKTVEKIACNKMLDRPILFRQITNVASILGNPQFDDVIIQNNKINNVVSGQRGYIPTSESYNNLYKQQICVNNHVYFND